MLGLVLHQPRVAVGLLITHIISHYRRLPQRLRQSASVQGATVDGGRGEYALGLGTWGHTSCTGCTQIMIMTM